MDKDSFMALEKNLIDEMVLMTDDQVESLIRLLHVEIMEREYFKRTDELFCDFC